MSLVGVVTAVTSAITGAVESVLVVVSSALPEPSSLLLVQPRTRINDSNKIENKKKDEKFSFQTLLDFKINVPIVSSLKGFFNGLFSINGCLSC